MTLKKETQGEDCILVRCILALTALGLVGIESGVGDNFVCLACISLTCYYYVSITFAYY